MFGALRVLVGIGGALLMAAGLIGLIAGVGPTGSLVWVIGLGAAGVLIATFEQVRYRDGASHGAGLRPTDEVFDDPTTGRRMRVWSDPSTGEREYRPEG